jgi:hypothetical protein
VLQRTAVHPRSQELVPTRNVVLEQTKNEMHVLETAKQSTESQTIDTTHVLIIRLRNVTNWTAMSDSSVMNGVDCAGKL